MAPACVCVFSPPPVGSDSPGDLVEQKAGASDDIRGEQMFYLGDLEQLQVEQWAASVC